MQPTYKSIQVFKNPVLEKLTHVHPLTPLVVWAPFVCWLLWRSVYIYQLDVFTLSTLGMVGLFSWSLAEYILHRYVFHYEGDNVWTQRLHFLIHGLHHSDPNDPTRLVMPPVASVIIALALFPVFRGLLGPTRVEAFFAFFTVGYLCYDYIHFSVHHFKPRTRVGKMLKNHHMQHHYVTPNARWGVSSPLWDFVFGTLEGDIKDKKSAV